MIGILKFNNRWYVEYDKDGLISHLDLEQSTIDFIKKSDFIKSGIEIEFQMRHIHDFPYIYAIPNFESIVSNEEIEEIKKTKTQHKITLRVSGFDFNSSTVTCDSYDVNSTGYWYFYDYTDSGKKYLAVYPVERTIIYKIEEVQTTIN